MKGIVFGLLLHDHKSDSMNFLAHIHIADACNSDITGNLLGDFVKGDPAKQYPPHIANGIKLHRFVDSYTDSHHLMKQAKLFFPEELRRFAPIALDLFWDHCLSSQWHQYHSMELTEFCRYAEYKARQYKEPLPDRYMTVTDRMWEKRWFELYRDFSTMELALARMSERSRRMGKLADCYDSMDKHYTDLSALFPDFYRDVLNASLSFVKA